MQTQTSISVESQFFILAKAGDSHRRGFFAGAVGLESGRARCHWTTLQQHAKIMTGLYARLHLVFLLQNHGVMVELVPAETTLKKVRPPNEQAGALANLSGG